MTKTTPTPRDPNPAPAVLEALAALREAVEADGLRLGPVILHTRAPLLAGEDVELPSGRVARYYPKCGAPDGEWTVCGPAAETTEGGE